MSNATGLYPSVRVDTVPVAAAGSAGGALLTKTVEVSGLGRYLREALAPWRKPTAVHDPARSSQIWPRHSHW